MKNYTIYAAICLLVFMWGIYSNKLLSTNNTSTLQPWEMSAWQLLDAQLDLEKQIDVLMYNKKELQSIRDKKTAVIRWETGTVENTPIEQMNNELGLQ